MTIAAWEHLVRDVVPRIEAEQQLNAAMAAGVPHMTADGARETISRWQEMAATVVREVVREATTQAHRFRGFLRRAGLNPDTGQEDPRFG